jgi:hypothetical protein
MMGGRSLGRIVLAAHRLDEGIRVGPVGSADVVGDDAVGLEQRELGEGAALVLRDATSVRGESPATSARRLNGKLRRSTSTRRSVRTMAQNF